MRVLVVYGSKRAGTFGIADMIGDALTEAGVEAEVRPGNHRADVATYDAVIVGGALYSGRWHRHARRFVKRHTNALRTRPVWLFSSGPLDDSASTTEIPPIPQVQQLINRIGARGHVTFGGRLLPDASGFPARAMAKTKAGDWRDPPRIRAWATAVAAELRGAAHAG
jgi:menaquinone-dependent protoporphyrinogen oxidase